MDNGRTQCLWSLFVILLELIGAGVRGQTYGPDIMAGVGDSVTFNFSLSQNLTLDFSILVVFKNKTDIQDSMYIAVSSNTVHPNSPNFHGQGSYQGNIAARQISFVLRDVTMSNAGLYKCGQGSAVDLIPNTGQKLVVQGRPTQPTVTPAFPARVAEGSDVILTCSSSATTLPEADRLPLFYSWFKGGNPVSGGTNGTLVVSPVRRADEGNYTCRSREGSDRMTSELSALVFLDVMHGPARVTLAPPDVYHEVRETTGAVPDIRCQVDCDPICNFQWRDRGGNPVEGTGSRLQLTSITRGQSGNFTCTASNQFGSGAVSVAIFATYPPDIRVLMSGCASNTTYVAVVDSSITLTCDVTDAYPSSVSVYEWSVNSSEWQTGDRQRQLTVTKSSGGQYACRASNSVGTSLPASVTVALQYPPELSFSPPSVTVVEGGPLEVECRVEARPDVTALRWSRVSGSLPPNTNLSLPRLSLSHVTRNLNGLYTCSATNRLSPCDVSSGGERTVSANVSVDVQYPPDVRVLMSNCTANTTYVTVVESSVTLTCDVTDANPSSVPVYEWSMNGSGWQTGARQRQLTVTKSSGGQYACRASNSVGSSLPASVTVAVQYPPQLSFSPPSVTVVEGGPLEVECRVEARPDVTALRWSRVSGSLPPNTNLSLPRLSLSHVTRNLSGLYTCSATNRLSPCDVSSGGERTVSANVSVDVQYGPEVTLLSVNSMSQSATVEEKAEWRLACDVSSNPRSLLRLLNDSSAAVLANQSDTLSLQRSWPAQCLHTGNYSCNASNSVGMVTSSSPVQLFVRCSPRQDVRVPGIQTTLASRIGGTVTFILPLVALPSPQHLWYRLDNSSGGSQQVLNVSSSRSGLNASLTLTSVQQSDFGLYFLDASNNVFTTTFNFTLFAADRPECPKLMEVKPLDTKVNISWERGFNNGGPQHFQVEVREGEGTWRNSSASVAEVELQGRYSLTLDLQPGRDYVLRVRAYNQYGHSLCDEEGTPVKIEEKNAAALIGGVVGSLSCAVIVVIIGAVIFHKRRATKKSDYAERDRTEPGNELSAVTASNKATSSKTSSAILEDNILYESSNGLRAEASASVHPILEDNPLYESSTASATVQGRSNQKSKETPGPSDGSNVYAQVVKKKTSAPNEKKKGGKNTKKGDVYENVELANSNVTENVYANSANNCDSSDKAALVTNQTAEPVGPVREIDNDGCVYVTVESTGAALKKPEKSAKPAIAPKPQNGAHAYQDDSVIYSDIDHNKKAPSLEGPDDSAQK